MLTIGQAQQIPGFNDLVNQIKEDGDRLAKAEKEAGQGNPSNDVSSQ